MLKSFSVNSVPGNDGLPKEFYKTVFCCVLTLTRPKLIIMAYVHPFLVEG